MSTNSRTNRRAFLKQSAAAGLAFTAPAVLRAKDSAGKLRVAMIGSGGRGGANLRGLETEAKDDVEIVALCDVNASGIAAAAAKYPRARQFVDFRKLFDNARDFDAVVVSTCEHTHALATLAALQTGKHVYCEKPLTHNIAEARVIREAAAKTKLATQMGNQMHSSANYRKVVELVQSGAIGPVRETHTWVSRAWGLQSVADATKNKDCAFTPDSPKGTDPVPAGLDWDLWTGPAPLRPFNNVYVPGPKWYRFWAFGNGTMSDLGSHSLDLPFWALKLKAPQTVESFGPPAHPDIAPATMRTVYEYGPRGELPAVRVSWYQGNEKPALWKENKALQSWASGTLFVGDKGMLVADYGKHKLLPEDQFVGFKAPELFLPVSPGHYAQWVRACLTGSPTGSNFEYAGWLTEANHLGNVAYRAGKKLEWDAAAMKATNCPEADAFIHREYRKGWKLA